MLIVLCRCALSPDTYLRLARELKHQADTMNNSVSTLLPKNRVQLNFDNAEK